MNKHTFLQRLEKALRHIPKDDREDAISYYTEYFEEMGADDNQDISESLGKPENIAKEIIATCTEKHIEEQKTQGGVKNSATVIWMIILAIFAAPIALPLAIAGIAVLFAILITLLAFIFAIFCAGFSLVFAGVMMFTAIFFAGSFGQGLVCAGMGFLLLGFGLLILAGMIKFGELCIRAIAALFKALFFRKKVA